MLKIKNLSKTYSKSSVKAVDSINLEVEGGQIFGFLGPNGAGKTTTIKMITGILSYNEGEINICSYDLKKEPIEAKRQIGYVSDNHVVYDKLTGREYVNFMADVYGVSKEDRKRVIDELLEIFKLTDAFNSQISTYSHGMKQKISIIGALVHEPKIWILDEPMTGLDPESAHQLKVLMRKHTEKGNVVFFSTHVLEVAEKLCDKIAIISAGKLIAVGSIEEIMQKSTDTSLEEVFLSLTNGD